MPEGDIARLESQLSLAFSQSWALSPFIPSLGFQIHQGVLARLFKVTRIQRFGVTHLSAIGSCRN